MKSLSYLPNHLPGPHPYGTTVREDNSNNKLTTSKNCHRDILTCTFSFFLYSLVTPLVFLGSVQVLHQRVRANQASNQESKYASI